MTWTPDKPQTPGWYWYRATPDSHPHPAKVFNANAIFYVWPVNDHGSRQDNVTLRLSDCSGEFAGPLGPPGTEIGSAIHIAEVMFPGSFLNLDDQATARDLQNLPHLLANAVAQAAIALTMFHGSKNNMDTRSEWERDKQIRGQVDDDLRIELGDLYYRNFEEVRLESQRRFLMRKSKLGIFPRSYSHMVPIIHAHSFMYAVDLFGKLLDVFCEYAALPDIVRTIRDQFNAKLPMVRKIRNSALHLEDRGRRIGSPGDKKTGKRIEGILGLSNLEGDRLCYTIDDGSYQKIAVNEETLKILVDTVNELLHSLPWTGPPSIQPF
jgi:hypothetical protein